MDGARFDRFARRVASAESRRSLLKGFLAATWPAIWRSIPSAAAVSPGCSSETRCTLCEFDAGAGTLLCEQECSGAPASALCAAAAQNPAYAAIRTSLEATGFQATTEAEAGVVRDATTHLMAFLITPFGSAPDQHQSAQIMMVQGVAPEPLVFAVVHEVDGATRVLTVDDAGAVIAHEVPQSELPSDATPSAARNLLATTAGFQVAPDPCRTCEWCDFWCGMTATVVPCTAISLVVCGPGVAAEPRGALVCGLITELFCNLVTAVGCDTACTQAGCANCDTGCENRDPDACGQCMDRCVDRDPDTTCCQGQCVDRSALQDDPRHCGTCGNDCYQQGLECCNGTCVNFSAEQTCGSCDTVCPIGTACVFDSELLWHCGDCVVDRNCSACETCNEQTGACEDTCGPCEVCDRLRGTCQRSSEPECNPEPEETGEPARTICENGGVECPGWVYGCCEPGQHCCEEFGSCCDDGCICCGLLWCCCDGLQCSEFIAACE